MSIDRDEVKRVAKIMWRFVDTWLSANAPVEVSAEIFTKAKEACEEVVALPRSRISPTGLVMDHLAPTVWHAICLVAFQYLGSRQSDVPFSADGALFHNFYGNRPVYRGQSRPWNIIPSGWRGTDQELVDLQREVFMNAVVSYMGPADALELDLFGRIRSRREADALAQHYEIPTNLVDFTFDPRIAIRFACGLDNSSYGKSDVYGTEDCAVVYFTSFVKLCATGDAKLAFPPVQSQRLYRQVGLFADFGAQPQTVPDVLDFEYSWMWVQQNCGRLFFPRSYPEMDECGELLFSFGDPMKPEPFFSELSREIRNLPLESVQTPPDKLCAQVLQNLHTRPPWRVNGLDPIFIYTDEELINVVKYVEYYLRMAAVLYMDSQPCLDPVVIGKLYEFDSSAITAINTVASIDEFHGSLDWINKSIRDSLRNLYLFHSSHPGGGEQST